MKIILCFCQKITIFVNNLNSTTSLCQFCMLYFPLKIHRGVQIFYYIFRLLHPKEKLSVTPNPRNKILFLFKVLSVERQVAESATHGSREKRRTRSRSLGAIPSANSVFCSAVTQADAILEERYKYLRFASRVSSRFGISAPPYMEAER